MTVAELIALLSHAPPESEVIVQSANANHIALVEKRGRHNCRPTRTCEWHRSLGRLRVPPQIILRGVSWAGRGAPTGALWKEKPPDWEARGNWPKAAEELG